MYFLWNFQKRSAFLKFYTWDLPKKYTHQSVCGQPWSKFRPQSTDTSSSRQAPRSAAVGKILDAETTTRTHGLHRNKWELDSCGILFPSNVKIVVREREYKCQNVRDSNISLFQSYILLYIYNTDTWTFKNRIVFGI